MRTLVACLAALALCAPAAAAAQPVSTMGGAGPDTYLELHLGAFLPQGDIDSLNPGVAFGGTFGARFNPNVSAELELGYYRANGGASGFGVGGASAVDGFFEAIPVTASVRLRYPMKVAELSAFGGGGIHFAHLSTSGSGGFHDTAFGAHVGAEAAFNLSPTMRVGFEVRRTFVNASFETRTTDVGGLRLAATLGYHF